MTIAVLILVAVNAKTEVPTVPVVVSCPQICDTTTEITIRLMSVDPRKRDVSFQIDWGDGTPLVWSRYFRSGEDIEHYHTYRKTGPMLIRARASAQAFSAAETSASQWCSPCTLKVIPNLVKWHFPLPAGTFSAPALDSMGNIYFGDELGWCYSLTPEGNLRWKYRVTPPSETTSIPAAPAVGNGAVYFGCENNYVYALSLDGKLLWSYRTATSVLAAPAIGRDGMIYVADDSGVVYCLNSQGMLRWQFVTAEEVDNGITLGPDGTVFVPSDSLYALSPNGKRLWAQGAQEEDSPFYGCSIGPDGRVYATNMDGYVYTLDPKTGRIIERIMGRDEDEIHSEVVFGPDGTLVFGNDGYYVNFYRRGDTVKAYECDDRVRSTPAISSAGTVYVLGSDGTFYALRTDGRLIWRRQVASSDIDWIPSSPVIAADGTVYVGSTDDYLYAFNGADGSLLWSYQTGGDI
ncbi:MAG: PQQ-binding-like beta-propeller repeat protein, partial [candidate division WOR-3 bacterium]